MCATRIAWFNHRDPRHPQAGGAELHMMEIGRRLAVRNVVDVYSERVDGLPSFEIIDGVRIHRVGGRFGLHLAALWVTLTGSRRYDVFVDDVAHAVPWFSTLFSRRVVAVVHHVHGDVLFRELSLPSSVFVFLAERLIPVTYREAPIVVVSESTRDELTKIGARPSMVHVIHNGVDAACIERRENESPLVLYMGRLKRYKNVDRLIDEFSVVLDSVPDMKLVVAGDGPELGRLRSKVRSKGLEGRVEILGHVSEETKASLLSKAWVNATMSDVEGWSISCLEAASFGTPTVACDVPGMRSSVLDGETGLLVPRGEGGRFKDALRRILSEPGLRGRLSDGAREWSRNFSWDNSALEFEELCRRAASGYGPKTI